MPLGGFFSGLGSVISGAMQADAQRYAVDNAKATADENLAFQKEAYGYQKDLQQEMFAREDNSIQRRVADLKAAGLSPVLAAGQGARAGDVVKATAPQRSELPAQLQAQAGGHIVGTMKAVADIGKTLAETLLTERSGEKVDLEAQRLRASLHEDILTDKERNRAQRAIDRMTTFDQQALYNYVQGIVKITRFPDGREIWHMGSRPGAMPGDDKGQSMTPSIMRHYQQALVHQLMNKDLNMYTLIKGSSAGAQIGNTLIKALSLIVAGK